MGVLPTLIGEPTEGVSYAGVKLLARAFDLVALAAGVRALETMRGMNVEEECQIRDEADCRKPVGGANFRFRQSATDDLVCISGQEEPIDQNDVSFG